MKIVIIGLTLSSSWGNGHATTWRSLLGALSRRGHSILFLEQEQSWYAENRDLPNPTFCELKFYEGIEELHAKYVGEIADADAVIVGSYVPNGINVSRFVLDHAQGITAFYDIDTPVTLTALSNGQCEYVSSREIPDFDLYLSFSGGRALRILEDEFGARRAEPLYCSVDPAEYFYEPSETAWELGYLGTYSADRQPPLDELLITPARQMPDLRFIVAGPQYPGSINWPANVSRLEHLPPSRHRNFYNSQLFTLNITRADMRRLGSSPSVRLFEAAACGVPIISDDWAGIETLFAPGKEILLVYKASDVTEILRDLPEVSRRAIGARAAEHVLRHHTSDHRAAELENLLALQPVLEAPTTL
ncbi:MAG TPA: glycosyltransferase [Chthoniobacterales bacterium]|jgi:spore maturation protein CgeB